MSGTNEISKNAGSVKKTVVTIVIIIAALILAAATAAFAVKASLITSDEAERIALGDAGVAQENASAVYTEFGYDDGRFVYEVEFYSLGVEYEYEILAKDGSVISRDIDGATVYDYDEDLTTESSVSYADSSKTQSSSSGGVEYITEDAAIAAALSDAGCSESEADFTEVRLDGEGANAVYDIEFYTEDAEYDYEISALDGSVCDVDVEFYAEVNGIAGASVDIEQAKAIAFSDAGISEDDAVYLKAYLDYDDGTYVYDIEFQTAAGEYEYEISPYDGSIISKDADR